MRIPLRHLTSHTDQPTLHKRVGHTGEANSDGGDIEPNVQPDSPLDVDEIQDRDHEQGDGEEHEAEVDPEASEALVRVEDDDHEEAEEADEHVDDGEDAVDGGGGVEVGEVVDGGDEGVPWEEEADAEGEVDDVG